MMFLFSTQPRLLEAHFVTGQSPDKLLPFVVTALIAQLLFSSLFIRAAARRFTSDRLAV